MGSFTEGRLSFSFRADTTDEVMAAFSALAVPVAVDAPTQPSRPLPAPVVEVDDMWVPDYEIMTNGDPDPHASTPWLHDWAEWLSTAMGVQTEPAGALTWNPFVERWALSCTFSWKTDAYTSAKSLGWIASHVETWEDPETPQLVGQLHYEYDPRPKLLWAHRGELVLEDLDPWEERRREPLELVSAELLVVAGLPGAGKTTYLGELAEEHPDWLLCDDFQLGAIENDAHPTASKYYGAAVRALQSGRSVVIADVRFGTTHERRYAVREILRLAPFTRTRLVSFEKDLDACERNVRALHEGHGCRRMDQDLDQLRIWADWYEPQGEIRPVWS